MDEIEKIPEHMWCSNCDHEWDVDDYFDCNQCPNCTVNPVQIYRTSSFAFAYAYMAKHPKK
jgi:Zn finger protein HypA/HybF involved in hydrogenase expression